MFNLQRLPHQLLVAVLLLNLMLNTFQVRPVLPNLTLMMVFYPRVGHLLRIQLASPVILVKEILHLIQIIFGHTLFTTKLTGAYYGLYFSVFFLAYHLFNIFIEKKSFLSIFFVILTLLCFSFKLSQKPVILAALVVFGIVFLVSKFIYKKKIYKILLLLMLGFSIIYPFLKMYYQDNQLLQDSLQRWTKIEVNLENDNLTIDDVIENVRQIEFGGSRDISAKRFYLWKLYFSEGIKYPIVTPYFGNAGIEPREENIINFTKTNLPAHNIFFKYMYHVGLPAGLCILLITFLFLTKGWKSLKYTKYYNTKLGLKPFEAAAIYAFIISIISIEFIGGFVDRSAINSWWFWSLVVLFFANSEIKNIKKNI